MCMNEHLQFRTKSLSYSRNNKKMLLFCAFNKLRLLNSVSQKKCQLTFKFDEKRTKKIEFRNRISTEPLKKKDLASSEDSFVRGAVHLCVTFYKYETGTESYFVVTQLVKFNSFSSRCWW